MKKIIAITGPSASSQSIYDLIEHLGFNYIFVNHNDQKNLEEIAKQASALILAGGVDLFLPYYGHELRGGFNMDSFDPKRDVREGILFNLFRDSGKFIWGICRGAQKIGMELGLSDNFVYDLGFSDVSHAPGREGMKLDKDICDYAHLIHFYDGRPSVWENSLHHQCFSVDKALIQSRPDINFIAYANTAPKKINVLEWFESDGLMAQQFHVENNYKYCALSQEIIQKFVESVND